ncbi:MAG TPA: sigma-54 dependent transcriptional regulator [Candidatus Eisenbacteria bacterium]|nr:sigma-54 dependent transcriptional regulator [Candidatus Eisenbacteria bacterium]
MPRLLIVDRSDTIRRLIESRLPSDFTIDSRVDVNAAAGEHDRYFYDLVVWNAGSDGAESPHAIHALKQFFKHHPESAMIVLSDLEKPDFVKRHNLQCEWLPKPIDREQLLAAIENTIHTWNVAPENTQLIVPVEFEGILAFTLKMRTVIQHIMEAAAQDIPVLISGETGTGKDLVAAAIHKRSKRNKCPFLPVNMGAIAPELIASELFGHERGAYTGASEKRAGLFEQAQGGTLFLDEITTMDEKTQVSLLRVLETKTVRRVRGEKDIHVDVRVIAATNENIEEAVRQGRFREDLFYRLDVFRIQLPPLRERHGALSLLTDHFVALFAGQYKKDIRTVSRETYRLIRNYPWPGNIRELKNVIQRAVLLSKGAELTPDLLPDRIRDPGGLGASAPRDEHAIQLGMSLEEVEKAYIKMALNSVSGNKVKAASLLKISRRTLYNKLKRFDLI